MKKYGICLILFLVVSAVCLLLAAPGRRTGMI